MKSLDKISEVFNVGNNVILPDNMSPPVQYNASDIEQDDDFQMARSALRSLITKNDDILTELIHISKNSEHPRAFEVAGQLVKAQTEIAKELVGLHKTKKDIDKAAGKSASIGTQNNIVFAGSTSELMKMINGEKNRLSNG
jgi:flagellar biosynthesis regulator FlbT